MTRAELMAELIRLQDNIEEQDIVTITYCHPTFSDAELAAHVARYRDIVSRRGA